MTFGRITIVTVLALAACTAGASAEDAALTAARQSVQDTYGQRLAAARKTETDSDDISLAEELIAAARAEGGDDAELFALADAAVELLAPLGTQSSGDLAREAMTLADSILPYTPSAEAQRRLQIASGKLSRMRQNGARPPAVKPVASAAARAGMDYVEALLSEPDSAQLAREALSDVRALVKRYRLTRLEDELAVAEEQLRWMIGRNKAIAGAKTMLAQAIARDNPRAVVAAGRQLAEAYIAYDGDLLTAGEYIDGTGHLLEQAVKTVVALQANESPEDPEQIGQAILALRDRMADLDEPAFTRIGQRTVELCDAYLAAATDGEQRVKAQLYRMQIDKLLGLSPADVMLAELSENYGVALQGKLQLLDDQRVRISYDFQAAEQLQDWNIQRNQWQVADALIYSGGGNGTALVTTQLRFRADRPVSVSLRANAFDWLAIGLSVANYDSGRPVATYQTSFQGGRLRRPRRNSNAAGGLALTTPYNTDRWVDSNVKLNTKAVYEMVVAIDGEGGMTWSINGTLVHEYKPASGDRLATDGYVTITLQGRNASKSNPTGYDDIVIEGVVLPTPKWKPVADEPADG